MENGEATHAEIAKARTEGVLTTARADRLLAEMEENHSRRAEVAARADRIAALLQTGGRPDPDSHDDRTGVAHHFEATLKSGLADLDPAQKASAIGNYVADTGMLPDAALDTLMGLAVSGKAADRIAAAGQLSDLLARYPEIRRRVPPTLIDFADFTGSLASTDAIPPDDIIKLGDGLIRDLTPGAHADRPNPGLVQLASFESGDSGPAVGQTDGQTGGQTADARPNAAPDGAQSSDGTREEIEGENDDISFGDDNDAVKGKEGDPPIQRRETGDNEMKPIIEKDLPHEGPHRSQFGRLPFSEMSTEDLEERLAAATGGLQNQARKLDELDRKMIAAQDKEKPIRKDIDRLEKELKPKLGVATVESLFDLVRKGKISVPTLMDIVVIALGEAEIEIKEGKELDPLVEKTRVAKREVEAQRDKVLIWLTEQRNIEAELEARKRRETR